VGTAVLLGDLDGGTGERAFVLEEKIGLVPCRVKPAGGSGRATFDIPRLPAEEGKAPDNATLAAALSISAGDVGFGKFARSAGRREIRLLSYP